MFRVTRFKGEGSVSDLVQRLFKFEGDDAEDRAKAAEGALLEANPQLRDPKSIASGTFIIVPEVENAPFAKESKPFAVEELAKQLRRAVTGIRTAYDDSLSRRTEGAQETLTLVKAKEVKSLAKKDETVKQQVAELSDGAKERLKQVKEAEKTREKVFEQMNKHLEGILKALG